jgi:hypothetical protein
MIRILLPILCSLLLAIQAEAETNRVSLNFQSSTAQIKTVDKNYKGDLSGVLLSGSFDVGEHFTLGLDFKDGAGKVSLDQSLNYSFNEYIAHSAFKFGERSGSQTHRNYGFSIGLGVLNKSVNFNGLKFSETQYPFFLGVDFDISRRLSMRIKGYSQLDKFDNNRAAFIELVWPISEKAKMVGRYSNYSSKINEIKHCGSDYVIGLEMHF